MARVSFIPHDQDREDQRREEKAERRAMRDVRVEVPYEHERFGRLDPNDPEYESVEAFAEYLYDDDREQYNHHELCCLNARLGIRVGLLRTELEGYGLTLKHRPIERQVRGFSDNPHNRWSGNPMAGGGGGAAIYGMVD